MGFAIIHSPSTIELCVIVGKGRGDVLTARGEIVSWEVSASAASVTTLDFILEVESCMSTPNEDVTKILQLPGMFDSCVTISGLQKFESGYNKNVFNMKLSCILTGWYPSHDEAAAGLMVELLEK